MRIVTAEPDDLKACFALEQYYAYEKAASGEGFFLPGASLQLYESLAVDGYLRLIKAANAVLAAFILAIPPEHPILVNLLQNRSALLLFPDIDATPANSVWIAKVATLPSFKRKGLATILYNQAFDDFRDFKIFTATAREPIRNMPSEKFHKAMNMVEAGEYRGTNKQTGEQTINTVWKYES